MKRAWFLVFLFLLSPFIGAQGDPAAENPSTEEPAAAESTDVGALPVPGYLEDTQTVNPPSPVTGGSYFRALGSLLLVLGLVLGLSWAARKYFPNRLMGATGGEHLKLVQNLPLGPNRFISLVEADGKRLLIGVTESRINLIKSLDDMAFEQALKDVEAPKTVRQLMEEGAP